MSESQPQQPLRIVTFNNLPVAFRAMQGWAAQAGHKVVMTVTSPGPKTRRTTGYQEIAALAGEQNIELLITTRMKAIATPILSALKPDLIVCFSFPWLLPPELLATARLGSINLHPALLPAYRGPNVLRQFYDAAPRIGATLHWIDGSFDTGAILAQHSAALPRPCTRETMMAAWVGTIMAALGEGAQKAIAGYPGRPQPSEGTSYAAEFTEQDYWLDLGESAYALQCKVVALSFFGAHLVMARINNEVWTIAQIDLVEGPVSEALPGSVIERLADGFVVQTGEGAARLIARKAD
jgi:methionyl-tRNA formyltransferase